MIQEVQALSLLALVASHFLIIKKCSNFTQSLEPASANLSSDLQDITGTLEEVADIIHAAVDGLGQSTESLPPAGSPVNAILTSLISGMMQPKQHGQPEITQDGKIYEINEENTPQTSD